MLTTRASRHRREGRRASAGGYNRLVSLESDLYQEFDPVRPLEAEEADRYVDWQKDLDLDDVKRRLARSVALSGPVPTTRLLTGHRGVGKSTELKRVKKILETGGEGRQLFVSYFEAERWLDLSDPGAPEVMLQIARQLVDDLKTAGFGFGRERLSAFFGEVREILSREVRLTGVKIPAGVAEFGLALKETPALRTQLRSVLEGQLPTLYDLINREVIAAAREWLRLPENGGYDDIVVIADELDRIPQRVVNQQGLTNHENLFLDHAGLLRALSCHVLYVLPIELALSLSHGRLRQVYGSEILVLPVVPVATRGGDDFGPGLGAVREVVRRRVQKAGARAEGLFADPTSLDRLCRLSGGHLRNVLIFLRSALDRSALPITAEAVARTIRRQADDIARPLGREDWAALRQVRASKERYEGAPERWYRFLKDQYVYAYEDADGTWYDWNPLLGEVPPPRLESGA